MKRTVCLIYRKYADTPSIERLFKILASEFEKKGIRVIQVRLPFGNGLLGAIGNLLFFRPPKADILHITGHVLYITLRLPPKNTILTVPDLAILRNKRGLRQRIIKKLYFDWPFKRVRHLTAISEQTKIEMIKATDCGPGKITVVAPPIDPMMRAPVREFNASRPTILQIGTAPHKNLERLIEAVNGLGCRIVIVGKLGVACEKRLRQAGIEFENLTALTDEEMRAAYERSDIVVFCSTFEGFGMPIIEAQSMGVPLITSDLPPMNDVAGKGAIVVDPFEAAQIREAIQTIIANPNLRNRIVAEGSQNIARFEASKIAGEYLNLYNKIEAENER